MQSSDLGLPLLANESESERTSTADFESGWLAMKEEHRGCCLRGLWTRRYCRFDKTGNGRLTVFEDDGHGPGGQVHCFAVHNCAELPSRMCKRSGRFDLEVSDADGAGAECWRGFAAEEDDVDRWIRAFVKYNASVQRPAAERSDRFRAIRKRKMDRGRHGVLRLAIVFIAGGFSLGVASAVKGTGPLRAAGSGSAIDDKCKSSGIPPVRELLWALVGMTGWILCSISLMTVSLVSGFDIDDFSEKHPRTFTSLSALMTLLSVALTTIDSGQHAHFYVDWIYGVPFCFFALFGLRSPGFRRHFTKVCKLALVLFLSTSRYTAAGFYHDPRPTRWLGLTVATCFVLASLFLCAFWFRAARSTIDGDRAAPSLLLWRMVYIACFLYTSIQILSLIAEFFAGICLLNFREAVALFGYCCVLATSAAMIFRRERMLQWMERTFEGKQRLADGAFIAALLDSEAVVPKAGQPWWVHLSDDNPDVRLHKDLSFRRRQREHNWRDGVVVQVTSDGVVIRMRSRPRDDQCVHGVVPPYGGGSTVTSVPRGLAGSHGASQTSTFATTEAVPRSHGRSGSFSSTHSNTKKSSLQRATSAAVDAPGERKRQRRPLMRSTSAAVISIDSEASLPPSLPNTADTDSGWLHTIKHDICVAASKASAQMQDPKVLMQQATKEMRCIDWSKMDRQLFVSSPRAETNANPNALYDRSRPVAEHDKIDFFISHSWSDQGHAKFKALSAIASTFRKEKGREPTFWFDKVCFNQENISNSLKVLPINVMRCNKVLALCGQTYAKRLWCAWELYILFAYRPGEQAVHDVQLVPLDDENLQCCKPDCCRKDNTADLILCAYCAETRYHAACMPDPAADITGDWVCAECTKQTQQKSGLLRQFSSPKQSRRSSSGAGDTHIRELMQFDLSEARCYDPNEEGKIRKIIGGGGGRSTFQDHIRSLARKVWSHSHNFAPVPSPPETEAGGLSSAANT